nr:ribonuclease H-like domain-containing protein [Tanacetum cinerariifolium]
MVTVKTGQKRLKSVEIGQKRTLSSRQEASDGRPRMDGTLGWRACPDKDWMEGTALTTRVIPGASASGPLLTGSLLFVALFYAQDKDGWHVNAISTSPAELRFNKLAPSVEHVIQSTKAKNDGLDIVVLPAMGRCGAVPTVTQTTTAEDGAITTIISSPVTAKEKTKKKNNVKARSMLLMALPNEHLMTFTQYKDAKNLFVAIETRFGGNEATKKTQKTFLKQMYENFSATSTESLDFIFNRLQKIVSQLANKSDLDTMSIDDLYNNFKIVKQEVRGTTSSNSSSQNMAFVSSPSTNNTNEVHTAYGVSTAGTQPSTASTQVNIASTQTSTANLSDATVYAFLANQSNWLQHVNEDLEQIHKDDLKEMDLKWQLALLSIRANRGPRNQDSRNMYQNSSRRTVHVEKTPPKAMVAIDGVGFEWSYMAEDKAPTNMALMAFLNSEKGLGYESYHLIPPPFTGLFSPPNLDLSDSGLEEFQQPEFEGYGPKTGKGVCEHISNEIEKYPDAPLVKDRVSDNKDCSVESPIMVETKTVVPTIAKKEFVRAKQKKNQLAKRVNTGRPVNTVRPRPVNTAWPRPVNTARPNATVVNDVRVNKGHPQQVQEDQGYVDSGCSRHMTGNMSYLSNFKEFDGGYVTFRGGAKRIKNYCVSQMCDKKNNVLFTDTGCFVLSPDFKLIDESQVLLKVPRRNNMYSVDMKNIVPKEILTCLVAKATLDESML